MNNNQPQQAGILRTAWIIFFSILYTANTCVHAITKGITKTSTRPWVDQTLHRWVRRMLRLLRITCRVHNPHHVEPQPGKITILMCNHSSLFDIPISLCAFPNHPIRMLAKKEMAHIPMMKQAMIASEFPFIDRKNRHQAIRDLDYVRQLLQSGVVMWIAPEGTRSHDGRVGPFKKGAFITAIQTNATIIPMGIRGAFDVLPARTLRFNLNQKTEIHIGEPIEASAFTLDNKELLIEKVRDTIVQLVGEQ
jgi:1-acyl-sn-glycerol-3-phosphate acyltransferase